VDALLARRGREVKSAMRAQVRSLETVSAGLAHEIRNPLTYIKNAVFVITESVQNIQKAMADEAMTTEMRTKLVGKAIDRMERMRTTADRGVQRVEEVLEVLRRYAREGYPTTVTPIEFDAMVRDVVEVVRPKGERTVTVSAQLEAAGQLVECVPDEMQQVIRNLIQNAIDASHDGGEVSVEDRGHGIPRELRSRIFTPFFSTKAPGDGMGLGLAIVDQIVKDAGGTIDLESTVDVGTLFQVRLPTSEWPALSPVAEPAPADV
jgi:signal transduction histidine kinase